MVAFVLGLGFAALVMVQQTNTLRGRIWAMPFISMAIGTLMYAQMRFVALGELQNFVLFQAGAALGAPLGAWWGRK